MDIDVIVERKSFDVELEVGNPVVEVKAPDHYNGPFDIFPSDEDQIIPVKEKMSVEDICVKGITGTEEITENGTYDVLTDKLVLVDVPEKITFESFTLGNYPFGDVKIDASITDLRTRIQTQLGITSIDFQNVKKTNEITDLFYGCTNLRTIYAPKVELVGNSLFKNCYALYEDDTINLAEIMPVATTFYSWAFSRCRFTKMILPPTIKRIYLRAFGEIPSLHTVYFTGIAESAVLDNSIFDATVTDIYVPWSEGAIRNAPWGATNATIHYDTVYDENWNVISST